MKTAPFLPAAEAPPFLFEEVFGNSRPVEIEIGCGKGKYLVRRAETQPDLNFLGIDRAAKWMKIGMRKSEKRNLRNLIFLKGEVREFLLRVAPESVRAFHVYFPDPWPKRRHRKRRLVTPDFLAMLHGKLEEGGAAWLATDDEDYFSQMRKSAAECPAAWDAREANARFAGDDPKTNYELKFEAAGRRLYYLELKKK